MKSLVKNIGLALAALVVVFGLTEVVARLVIPPVTRINATLIPRSILTLAHIPPGTPHMLIPNSSGVQEFNTDPRDYFDDGAKLTYHINSLGFRGEEVQRQKPPGLFRIIGLGDSFTFGTGVRNEHTVTSILEQELDKEGRRFEVLNLGVMGFDTVSEFILLEHLGGALDPDLVIVFFFLNDGLHEKLGNPFNIATKEETIPWYRSSRLVDYMIQRVKLSRSVDDQVAGYHRGYVENTTGWQSAQAAFRDFKRASDTEGFRLAVVIWPILWELGEEYPFAEVHDIVATFVGDELGVPLLDLQPEFAEFDGPDLWVHPVNQHPNEIGTRIAGEAVYRFLKEEGLLEPATAE